MHEIGLCLRIDLAGVDEPTNRHWRADIDVKGLTSIEPPSDGHEFGVIHDFELVTGRPLELGLDFLQYGRPRAYSNNFDLGGICNRSSSNCDGDTNSNDCAARFHARPPRTSHVASIAVRVRR